MRRQEESWRTKSLSSKVETRTSPRHAQGQGQHAFAQCVVCDLGSKGPIGGDAPIFVFLLCSVSKGEVVNSLSFILNK